MHYIINPKLFYLIEVAGNISFILGFFGIIIMIAGFCYLIWLLVFEGDNEPSMYTDYYGRNKKPDEDYDREVSQYKAWRSCHIKNIIKIDIIAVIFVLISASIPSESTCYKMMAASLLTTENLEIAENKAEDIVEYIVDVALRLEDRKEETSETDQK